MSINFNVSPYYDDFDPSKNFHRILFKPGSAVQARELTQSQTILQNQISNFASAIYSQNTPISGGQVTLNQNCYYLKLNATYNGATITAANFKNQVIQDASGLIVAKVIAVAETTSTSTSAGDPPTLIVSYLSGQKFTDGLVLQTTGSTTYYASIATSTTSSTSTGLASTASIASGVFYVVNGYSVSNTTGTDYSIGNFVQVDPQTIILDKYDNTPSYRIGLLITESVYDYQSDSSLLDPAIGASNYQAPGADRYVITLSLITLPLTAGSDNNFIELVRVNNGNVVKQVDGTVYSTIDDYFAKRDYETNGDYIVNDFKLTPSANTVSNSVYDLSIGKGVAYVHGYRIENQSTLKITNNRAQTSSNVNNNPIYIDYGNYYTVDTSNGVFDISTLPQVDLHCVSAGNIVTANANTYTSTLVGTAFMRNFNYVSGTGSNTKNYIYNAYISDITANTLTGNVAGSGTFTTFSIFDSTNAFSSVNNAYLNVTVLVNTGGVTDTKNITAYNGATKTITVDSNLQVVPTSSTTFTLLFQSYDVEAIVQKSGSYALTANVNINTASGKVNGVANNDSVLYSAGTPELIFKIGYPYVSQLVTTSYTTQRVYRQKAFTGSTLTLSATSSNASSPLKFNGTGLLSGSAAQQSFIVIDNSNGSILDFNTSGNTITISGDKTSATLSSTTYSGKTVTIIAQVFASSGDSSSFVLKSKNLVTGNTTIAGTLATVSGTSAYQDLAKGQITIARSSVSATSKMSLYVNDVKRITKIYDLGTSSIPSAGASLVGYTDITSYYTLDNGQRDSYYDHAAISLIPGAPLPVGNILIVVDYYSHTQASSGDGYFSIQSYNTSGSTYGGVSTSPESYAQIPTYTAKDGIVYKLGDCIDFRPCRVNGQTAYVWEYSATQTSTNDIGILIPNNLTNFTGTYQYYLARKDKLVLTKDRNFVIIQGNPAVSPSLPNEPAGSLVIANLLHDPYTAYVPGEAPQGTPANLSVNKVIHKVWTKEDITNLENRVNNLEYYTSLSILEQNANSLQVPDSVGLNRFKNGILVDNFSTFATADTSNPEFSANINIRRNQLTALQFVNNFQLQNPVVLSTLGTLENTGTYKIHNISGTQTNIFTLPYTTDILAVQQLASNQISVNPFSVSIQEGQLQLNPPMDNWVDVNQPTPIINSDPTQQVNQSAFGLTYTNTGDWQTIPGTSTFNTTYSSSTSSSGNATTTTNTTTTQTYASQLQNSVTTSYSPSASSLNINNGYLTNIAILPYIRPQRIIIRAKGLLVNSNVSTFFDGVDVSSYMTQPNTIELTGVTGTFNQDDIVGFYVSNTFYPIARVVSVYNYPNGTQARIYCADITLGVNTLGTTTLQNGTYDVNGNYIAGSATATGTVSASAILALNQSGSISAAGGGWSNTLSGGTTTQFYGTPAINGHSTFLNNYGIWGDGTNGTSYNAVIPVTFTSGTYTVTVGSSGSATVYANGTSIGTSPTNTPSSTSTFTYTAPSATVNIGWAATSSGTTTSAFAMTIADSSGNIVFSSITPNVSKINAGTEIVMPTGGAWFQGATQVRLDPSISSNTANFYVGSKINITSRYVYSLNVASVYSPPTPAPSGGSGGCCVVATALTEGGDWSFDKKMQLVNWSINTLDKFYIGERLHRGYHMVASKIIIPLFFRSNNKIMRKYAKWSFNNATNMVQGKKFNPLSIPNSLIWITLMLVTGLFVTKEQAETSWKSLYKDKK
jgi:hypothetical protein